MALFTGVQHLCTFIIVAPSPFAKCFEGVVHHQRLHLCWCFRIDRPIERISSSLVLYWVPRSGSFILAKRSNSMDSWENERDSEVQNPPPFLMTMQGVTPLLSRTSCAAGSGRFWNTHRTHPIWVHAITISSPKWKNYCEGLGTTQVMHLSML